MKTFLNSCISIKNFTKFLALLCICTAVPAFAQELTSNHQIPTANNASEAAIINKLSPFLRERDYVVHVTYKTDTVQEAASFSEAHGNEFYGDLPGIFNPSFFSQSKDTSHNNVPSTHIRYRKSKLIEVILSDIYDNKDLEFIRDLVKMSIPINEKRGDSIAVYERKFPQIPVAGSLLKTDTIKDSVASAALKPENAGAPIYNNTITQSETRARADSSYANANINNNGGLWKESNLPFILLTLLMVLIIGLLIYIVISQKSQGRADSRQNLYQELHPSQVNKTEGEKTSLEQDDQKQLFVSHFIKSPKSIADLIENDLISGGHESMAKYARAIAAVNAELVHLIEPYLEESTRLNLQQRIREFQGTGDQATYEIRQVLSRLKNLQEPDGKSIFSFLNRINDQQLMFMLRDEQPETIAITLAQLKVERAQNILSHFDLNKKTEILTRMGMISMHPSRVFKEVALRLTEKLPELEGMKDLTIDGLSGVLNILDNLSEDEQREMLSRITEKAPKLAGELNKEFFGFGNITTIDDKIVEKAIREIETEQLLNALAGYRGDVVEKIINLRPGREQMVLRSQIAINGIPPEAGTEIRRKIINSIRNQLKKA